MSSDIRKVKDMNGLIAYFADNLGWKIDIDDFDDIDDIAYDFSAEDIGLKEEAFARIKSLRQLPPLVDSQKWGIFCVEFDSKRFEVTALRKILSGLIPTRRNSTEHAVWNQKDLLFLCFWGAEDEKTIGIAHFQDKDNGLPQIRMISCAPSVEDFTQIQVFENRLEQLKWPSDYYDHEKWANDWSEAFVTGYRQTIRDAATLTSQLAKEAQNIRNRIMDTLAVESANGYVHLLFEKFKNTLIHNMKETEFADMYAQTVVYGLFSARCMDNTQEDFSADEAIDCIPLTNPFLKSLMKECLGSRNDSKLSFDELEIANVVELLKHTKTNLIIQDFNRQTGGGKEDPVIHFYEDFLNEYDKQQKVQRGVYYTPQPVVDFIVHAVDCIIKTEFGYKDGIASTETKKVEALVEKQNQRRGSGAIRLESITYNAPAIQVLDPATGTGTFIRQCILQIFDTFKNKNAHLNEEEFHNAWNDYVPKSLLPRLNAFELMMAPYAVAHMKLAMVLKDTGYDFNNETRLNVFLTNTLEKAGNTRDQLSFWDTDPLALESIAANRVKKSKGVNIIMGNPPYKADSLNKQDWIMHLMEDYKKEPQSNERLKEKNPKVVNDDYVKFIRYAEEVAMSNDDAIVAFINPHSYVDNLTFRGMRWDLLTHFDEIYVLDLHGNVMSREVLSAEERDENVFDIQQGVSINFFIKNGKNKDTGLARVYYSDLAGSRKSKYAFLSNTSFKDVDWIEVFPEQPNYFFKEKQANDFDYSKGISLNELFPTYVVGVKTSDDEHLISMTPFDSEFDQPYVYRPFDERHINYDLGKVARHRYYVMKHFIGNPNLGLVINRQVVTDNWSHVQVVDHMIDSRLHYSRKGNPVVCPMLLYDEFEVRPNINSCLVKEFEKTIGCTFSYSLTDSQDVFDIKDLIDYVYAVLFSRKYRDRYIGLLSIDFPKVPLPANETYFREMVALGSQLRELHLMNAVPDNTLGISFFGDGDNKIVRAKLKDDKLYINKTQYFSGVTNYLWNYPFGGYHSLQKWFKDRQGEMLSLHEIEHIITSFNILNETDAVVRQIDDIIIMP